jgi:hypothetical protein
VQLNDKILNLEKNLEDTTSAECKNAAEIKHLN